MDIQVEQAYNITSKNGSKTNLESRRHEREIVKERLVGFLEFLQRFFLVMAASTVVVLKKRGAVVLRFSQSFVDEIVE
jgi:hypothetical protein